MRKNIVVSLLLGGVVGCYILIAQLDSKKHVHAQKDKESAMQDKPLPSDEITLPSGLKYQILHDGNGQTTPKPGQRVTVHYTGWLNDGNDRPGRKFDSSYDHGRSFSFIVGSGNVIQGWDEGLLEMHLGDKVRFFIPPQLGYGTYGYPPVIPANAHLIFDIELIEIA